MRIESNQGGDGSREKLSNLCGYKVKRSQNLIHLIFKWIYVTFNNVIN